MPMSSRCRIAEAGCAVAPRPVRRCRGRWHRRASTPWSLGAAEAGRDVGEGRGWTVVGKVGVEGGIRREAALCEQVKDGQREGGTGSMEREAGGAMSGTRLSGGFAVGGRAAGAWERG